MNKTNPTPTQQETLLPCPWCLGPAVMSGTNNGDIGDGYMWKIGCAEENDCTVQPEFYYESEQLAVTRWNTRAAVAGPRGDAESLVKKWIATLQDESRVTDEDAEDLTLRIIALAPTASPVPAESDDDDEDRAWERQSTINSIAYEFMKLFGVTAKDGKTHDEMRLLFDAAREIITRNYPVLIDLHVPATAPAERTRAEGEPTRIRGWILGNEYQERGYHEEGSKGDGGESRFLPVVAKAAKEPCRHHARGCPKNQPDESYWCAPCSARHVLATITKQDR